MAEYGVQPTGFVRKPLTVILAEIEAQLITEFGPGFIQTAQSPAGQINGLMANLIARLWEDGEDTYQSYDPDQAEGVRLDTLGRLRLLTRADREPDIEFRQAITNAGRARVDLQDLARAVRGLSGVTYTQVFVNDSPAPDADSVPPNSVAVAVLGGNDDEIAETMRLYIVPGISTYGNTRLSTNIDGYCRTMTIIRPALIPVTLEIFVVARPDKFGCPAPSATAIKTALLENIALLNGQDISWFLVRSIIEAQFPTVEVTAIAGERDGITYPLNTAINIGFVEIATLAFEDVTVTLT